MVVFSNVKDLDSGKNKGVDFWRWTLRDIDELFHWFCNGYQTGDKEKLITGNPREKTLKFSGKFLQEVSWKNKEKTQIKSTPMVFVFILYKKLCWWYPAMEYDNLERQVFDEQRQFIS